MLSNDTRLSRRDVLKYFGAMTAALSTADFTALAQDAPPLAVKGYGDDPNLLKIYAPGDAWPLTFTPAQRQTAAVFADVIIPADDFGPAATSLRVPDFIDEWISAPYPLQEKDRPVIVEGLAWLEAEAQKRFGKDFAAATDGERATVCADICWPWDAKPEFAGPAKFFVLFRALASGAYYATPEGWKAVGYVGNIPLASFDGPPPEVLDRLELVQTVA